MGEKKNPKVVHNDGRKMLAKNLERAIEKSSVLKERNRVLELSRLVKGSESAPGPSKSSIQRILSAEGCSIDHLFLIADALDIDAYTLLLTEEQAKVVDVMEAVQAHSKSGDRVHVSPLAIETKKRGGMRR